MRMVVIVRSMFLPLMGKMTPKMKPMFVVCPGHLKDPLVSFALSHLSLPLLPYPILLFRLPILLGLLLSHLPLVFGLMVRFHHSLRCHQRYGVVLGSHPQVVIWDNFHPSDQELSRHMGLQRMTIVVMGCI